MVAADSALLTVTGVLFGTVASAVTIVSFSFARIDDAWPSLAPGRYAVIVAMAVVLTFAAAVGATRKAIATTRHRSLIRAPGPGRGTAVS